jgi:K+-sensing histidine kinase KdpD
MDRHHDSGLPVSLRPVTHCAPDDGELVDLAHELRSTLAIVTLSSGNLELLYDRLSDAQRQKLIREIRTHIQKLNEFIEDVLALSNANGVTTM